LPLFYALQKSALLLFLPDGVTVAWRELYWDLLVSVRRGIVLAKKTTKNQITLPKKVVACFTGVEYFDISTDGGVHHPASSEKEPRG
jgi:hypothetical protein